MIFKTILLTEISPRCSKPDCNASWSAMAQAVCSTTGVLRVLRRSFLQETTRKVICPVKSTRASCGVASSSTNHSHCNLVGRSKLVPVLQSDRALNQPAELETPLCRDCASVLSRLSRAHFPSPPETVDLQAETDSKSYRKANLPLTAVGVPPSPVVVRDSVIRLELHRRTRRANRGRVCRICHQSNG